MSTTTESSWDEIKALFREIARRQEEDRQHLRETERLLKERSQETDRLFRENARELRALKKQIRGLGDKFGYFTEGLALPSLERMLTERFGMTNVSPRHRVRIGEREHMTSWPGAMVRSVKW